MDNVSDSVESDFVDSVEPAVVVVVEDMRGSQKHFDGASQWWVDDGGTLQILGSDQVVGTFAPGTWAFVRCIKVT